MALLGFEKQERLKNKHDIDRLFSNGSRLMEFPFIVVWDTRETLNPSFKMAISVPKKYISSAVLRNRIKRLFRECYRKQKSTLFNHLKDKHKQINLLFIYTDSEILSYSEMDAKISVTLHRLTKQL